LASLQIVPATVRGFTKSEGEPDFESESEALSFVRELIGQGWKADELVMMFDDPALADEDLPPGVTGEELARRAEAAASNPVRRTA
jgi:hypothetical protein